MKIYKEIRINIETGETLYEDSYEHTGDIALCMGGIFGGGGGGGSSVSYQQSPEQADVYKALLPFLQQVYGGGGASYNIPQYPTAPTAPSMQGVLSGTQQYQIPQQNVQGYGVQGYGVPDIGSMMPSKDWYSSLSPEIMAGIRQPYTDASQQLTESLGGAGSSAMAGPSGALGGAQADFWSKAGTQMGQQAWNMVSPALQQGWQANLGQNQYLSGQQNLAGQNMWSAQLGQNQMGYQNQLQERQTDYQNILAQQQAGYGGQQSIWEQQLQQNMMPYSMMPGLMGGTYSSPVVNQGGGSSNAAFPMLAGAGLGGYMAAGTAMGGPVGAGLGALLGLSSMW